MRTRKFSRSKRRLAAATALALLGTATFGATAASPASAALPQCFMNSLPTPQWVKCELSGVVPPQ